MKKYLSDHEFVSYNSQSEEIYCIRVIHLADNFRRHVSGGSAGIFGIVRLELSRNSKIRDSNVAFVIKYQILRFEIAVHDFVLVKIFE